MNVAHQPDGRAFVFNEDGKTLVRDLTDKPAAIAWIIRERMKATYSKKS